MMTTRARGLASLHTAAVTVVVGGFFLAYAEFILWQVPFVRLTREVNLVPYLLCVLGGMLLARREVRGWSSRFDVLRAANAARLAARQVALMAALLFAMMFATQDRSISRLFLGSFLVWAGLLLWWLNAWLPGFLARRLFQRGHQLPTLFVGPPAALARLNDWIARQGPLGVHPVGLLTDEPAAAGGGVPLLGATKDLARVLAERTVAQVVRLGMPADDAEASELVAVCQEHGVRLLLHSDLAEKFTHPFVPTLEDDRHFFALQEEPLEDPVNRLVKRGFDLALALPVVVLLLPPLCLWVGIMQRWQAPGPLFHTRERCGRRGHEFRMLKFRTMRAEEPDAPAESRQAVAEDARIFPFGHFMRRHSLDEFPQFWNVLAGHMSVVGPRPYMPLLDDAFRRQTRGHRVRQIVKPGITGLAQSMGYRGQVLHEEMLHRRLQWDLHYITHWSIWLDVQITLRTLVQIVRPPPTAR
ncbi:MAG: exopolysaccharide biosynthesis polyprenyl glycosylphosphotransferase [Opitutaceae bacterium]